MSGPLELVAVRMAKCKMCGTVCEVNETTSPDGCSFYCPICGSSYGPLKPFRVLVRPPKEGE